MVVIIFAAAWFALRYRQSNYEPPESTVTVTPPPAIQGAPSGDQPAAIAPAPAAPEAPAPMAAPQVPTQFMSEEIGGIGAFNTIAGETMFDFDPAPPMTAAPPAEAPMAPPPAAPEAPPMAPPPAAPEATPMAPPPAEAPMPPPATPEVPPATTGTEMYMAPPPEHSLDGEIEMYTRSGYAEI